MKNMMRRIAALLLALAWMAAPAQTPQTAAPGADPALYTALGEKPGIARLMDDFVNRLRADARIGTMFKDVKPAYLKEQLTNQICVVSGGPCVYDGEDMKKSHAGLGINTAHFNALVEVLQDAMGAQGVPFATQNRLLARLAPMHRDIITR